MIVLFAVLMLFAEVWDIGPFTRAKGNVTEHEPDWDMLSSVEDPTVDINAVSMLPPYSRSFQGST